MITKEKLKVLLVVIIIVLFIFGAFQIMKSPKGYHADNVEFLVVAVSIVWNSDLEKEHSEAFNLNKMSETHYEGPLQPSYFFDTNSLSLI